MKRIHLILLGVILVCSSCYSSKSKQVKDTNNIETTTKDDPDAQNQGSLIVQLTKESNPLSLQTTFKEYRLKHKSETNKTLNEHIFMFDPRSVRETDMIAMLLQHKEVIRVKSNQVSKDSNVTTGKSGKKGKVILKK